MRKQSHRVIIQRVARAAQSRHGWSKEGLAEFVRVCEILNSCSLGKLDSWHIQVLEFGERWARYTSSGSSGE